MDSKQELVDCIKSLYAIGLTTSVSGNHSIRLGAKWMWLTPSGVPRYNIRAGDLVKVDLKTGKATGKTRASIELEMHRGIYNVRRDVNAIVHSPFTIGVSISSEFRHVIEEPKMVFGEPAVIANRPSGSAKLAKAVSGEFEKGAQAVVIKNHGVVAGGRDVHHARAVVEHLKNGQKF